MSEPLLKREDALQIVALAAKSRLLSRGPETWRLFLEAQTRVALRNPGSRSAEDIFLHDLMDCAAYSVHQTGPHPLATFLRSAAGLVEVRSEDGQSMRPEAAEFMGWAKRVERHIEQRRREEQRRAEKRRRKEQRRAEERRHADDRCHGEDRHRPPKPPRSNPRRTGGHRIPRKTDPGTSGGPERHNWSDPNADDLQRLLRAVLVAMSLAAAVWWWAMA